MTLHAPKDPELEARNQNPWYMDDQFKLQLENPAVRGVILTRWEIFKEVIEEYTASENLQTTLQVLDAGCGDGINLIGLKDSLEETGHSFELHACDYNDLRLERARKFDFVQSLEKVDLLKAPYEDNQFDIILCNHVLEHIPEMEKAITELGRILKPGGRLILNIPNEGCLMARLRNHVLQREILKTTDHVHFLTKDSFGKIIESTNLPVLRWERRGFFIPYLPLTAFLRARSWGRAIESALAGLFPSQGTDLLAVLTKR